VWGRVRIPLLAGERLTGLQRLLIFVDSANGVSGVLPFQEWIFVPTALTATVHRHPQGEWVFMRAETTLSEDGIGSCKAEIADVDGPIVTASQPLVVARRNSASVLAPRSAPSSGLNGHGREVAAQPGTHAEPRQPPPPARGIAQHERRVEFQRAHREHPKKVTNVGMGGLKRLQRRVPAVESHATQIARVSAGRVSVRSRFEEGGCLGYGAEHRWRRQPASARQTAASLCCGDWFLSIVSAQR
jgi:hypothetical protein